MVDFLSKYISNCNNVSRLNTPVFVRLDFQRITICYLQETCLKHKDTESLEIKEWTKAFHGNSTKSWWDCINKDYIHFKGQKALVALNRDISSDKCFSSVSDITLNF